MALQRTRGLSAAQILGFAGCGSAVQGLPSGRSPLNAVALGLIRRIPHGVDALAVMIAFALTACSGGDSRFVDTRVAEDVYFIQEARKIERSGDSQATQEALCHAVRLTLEAGYDYWRTEPSGRSPQIKAEEGEEIVVWTIRMYRGVAPAADQKAFDARRMQHLMCERRSS